jgi:hypothetical protein
MSERIDNEAGDLAAALARVTAARQEVATRIRLAVEEICRDTEKQGLLPIVELRTSPEIVYGGLPRSVKAHVTVEFRAARESGR